MTEWYDEVPLATGLGDSGIGKAKESGLVILVF